jgi:hypothetical protein
MDNFQTLYSCSTYGHEKNRALTYFRYFFKYRQLRRFRISINFLVSVAQCERHKHCDISRPNARGSLPLARYCAPTRRV